MKLLSVALASLLTFVTAFDARRSLKGGRGGGGRSRGGSRGSIKMRSNMGENGGGSSETSFYWILGYILIGLLGAIALCFLIVWINYEVQSRRKKLKKKANRKN
jgi:uncharacterized membrane protein